MSLHPDIIDAMVAAGASAGMDPGAVLAMVQAACRAAWNVVNTQGTKPTGTGEQAADRVLGEVNDRPCSPLSSECDIAEQMRSIAAAMHALDGDAQRDAIAVTAVTPSRNAMTGAERQKRYRDKHNATVTASVTRNGSLSLSSKDLFNYEEREGERAVTALRTVTPATTVPMSPDWQPNEKALQLAKETLGDIGATNMLAKFRIRYEDELRAPRAWQRKFREWVVSERNFAKPGAPPLPLMRKLTEATGPPRGWQPGMPTREEMLKEWGGDGQRIA